MFIQARALTTIYRKGVASLGSSATRWTVSVAYPTVVEVGVNRSSGAIEKN